MESPKCGHNRTHCPGYNKIASKENKTAESAYVKKQKHLQGYKRGDIPTLPLDNKGKEMTKIPPLKLKPEHIVCKCHARTHSTSVGGFKCDICNDGTCELCRYPCRFVCSKRFVQSSCIILVLTILHISHASLTHLSYISFSFIQDLCQ